MTYEEKLKLKIPPYRHYLLKEAKVSTLGGGDTSPEPR